VGFRGTLALGIRGTGTVEEYPEHAGDDSGLTHATGAYQGGDTGFPGIHPAGKEKLVESRELIFARSEVRMTTMLEPRTLGRDTMPASTSLHGR
jgi:hypothetical protein